MLLLLPFGFHLLVGGHLDLYVAALARWPLDGKGLLMVCPWRCHVAREVLMACHALVYCSRFPECLLSVPLASFVPQGLSLGCVMVCSWLLWQPSVIDRFRHVLSRVVIALPGGQPQPFAKVLVANLFLFQAEFLNEKTCLGDSRWIWEKFRHWKCIRLCMLDAERRTRINACWYQASCVLLLL